MGKPPASRCGRAARSRSRPARRCRPAPTPSSRSSTPRRPRPNCSRCSALQRPGEGMVRADEDAAPRRGARPGRPAAARRTTSECWRPPAASRLPVHARPRVTILSTGDELVPADTPELALGQVRDATAPALAALVREAGGEPRLRRASCPTTARRSRAPCCAPPCLDRVRLRCRRRVRRIVGRRARRDGGAVASLGEPGIWCHGLALRPGKPTLLADCGGVPVIGLPGNPRSALVVFRLIGMPIVRAVGGCTDPPPEPTVRARLERDLPSAAGRLDVVQVRLAGAEAVPLFGSSSLLSILTAADGYIVVPESATGAGGRQRGRRHAVPVAAGGRMSAMARATPFIHDRPGRRGARRLGGGLRRRRMPRAARHREFAARRGGRAGHGRAGLGAYAPPRPSTPLPWTASRSARPTPSARARPPPSASTRARSRSWTPATRSPATSTRSSCARTCTRPTTRVELRAAAAPYQHVRSIGEDVSAAELLLPAGSPAAAGGRGGRGGRRRRLSWSSVAGRSSR